MDDGATTQRGRLAGLVVGSLLAAVLGVVVGVITTFTHRQWEGLGVVAGLAIVAALLAGLRLIFDSRTVAAAAAIGVLAALALLTMPGAGGSVLVVDEPVGWVWAYGAPLLAATVVVWPRKRTAGTT